MGLRPNRLKWNTKKKIHAERDESEHRDVEADLPVRIGPLNGILRFMGKIHNEPLTERTKYSKPGSISPYLELEARPSRRRPFLVWGC